VFGLYKGFAEKTTRQRTGPSAVSEASPYSPGPTRGRPMHKGFLTIDLKEFLVFSAGLIFETVLLCVRNKMKKVLDELYVIGLYKH